MSLKSIDELGKLVVRLHLVEPSQLDECLARLGPSQQTPEELLRLLESRSYLTSYQAGQIAKGEFDTLVVGGYKLLYRNASGSFARVYRAAALDDDRMVALKLLRQRWADDPRMVAQFRREAEVCKRFRHKNIVPIYEVGSEGDKHYFTMEFVEGGNLRDFITIRKKLSPVEATRCLLDMSEGLEYALRMGATHRDLKLSNVLMGTDGVAKLVDFGLAGDEISGGSSGDDVQRALEYATLEKGTGVPDNDPRSDLFFLGAIYYELLTGSSPWPRTRSREERKQLLRYTNVRPLRSLDPNLPRSVVEIVERLMKVNPVERYQRPSEVIADLRRVFGELGAGAAGDAVRLSQPNAEPDEANGRSSLPTVMCVTKLPKQQDVLREYLSKRGFRVLVLGDVQRALNRVRTDPPDCVILMGESIGKGIVAAFQEAARRSQAGRFVAIAVLSEKQSDLKTDCEQTTTARVLTQPLTLRELRREIHLAFQRLKHDSREMDVFTVGGP